MDAQAAYRALHGLFCIYKPAQKTIGRVIHDLKLNILKDINKMPVRYMKERVVYKEENIGTNLPVATTVPDLADHPLVIGERYVEEDFFINRADSMSSYSSGVVVMNINGGHSTLKQVAYSGHMRVYHVKGQFGKATLDFTPDGKIVEKTTYYHVSQDKLDHVLAGIQSSHQRYMYQVSKVDLQSQQAYELAKNGLVRPNVGRESNPIIYGVKCIEFKPPHFTLEIHCVNESCKYLMKLIHEIGLELRTTAVCTQLRRLRFGHFTLTHSLLRKHWNVQSIIENIQFCKPLLTPQKLIQGGNIVEFDSPEIVNENQQKQLVHGQNVGSNFVDQVT